MSEYYLADERARQREREQEREKRKPGQKPREAQDVKITLLGDFLFTSSEPKGCDPYNSSLGKTSRDAWQNTRNRR